MDDSAPLLRFLHPSSSVLGRLRPIEDALGEAILRLLGAPCAIVNRLEPSWGRSWAVLSVSCCEPRPSWPVLGPPEVKMLIFHWFLKQK